MNAVEISGDNGSGSERERKKSIDIYKAQTVQY